MSVPNQIPESNYVGNGTTKTFAANFEYASDSDVFVTVNGVAPEIGQAAFANGIFTFTTAPANGAAVRVYRSTPVERDTEYDNHDNVFRPRVVNIDFDRIWYVLQEYLLSLGITNARITQEIADRIQADAEMMNYILNEDNELKADYILRDENLKKYIDQTLGALLDLPDFQGIEAQFVKDSSGSNQQQINDFLKESISSVKGRDIWLEDYPQIKFDGTTEDGAAIQAILQPIADEGVTVHLKKNAKCLIGSATFRGLFLGLKKNWTFDFNGCEVLRGSSNTPTSYNNTIELVLCERTKFINGSINGQNELHGGVEGQCHNIALYGCKLTTFHDFISHHAVCDNLYQTKVNAGDYRDNGSIRYNNPGELAVNTSVFLTNTQCLYGYRQGMTIGVSSKIFAVNCSFSYTGKSSAGGISPTAGIDSEPNATGNYSFVESVTLINCDFISNAGSGCVIDYRNFSVSFTNCNFINNDYSGINSHAQLTTIIGCRFLNNNIAGSTTSAVTSMHSPYSGAVPRTINLINSFFMDNIGDIRVSEGVFLNIAGSVALRGSGNYLFVSPDANGFANTGGSISVDGLNIQGKQYLSTNSAEVIRASALRTNVSIKNVTASTFITRQCATTIGETQLRTLTTFEGINVGDIVDWVGVPVGTKVTSIDALSRFAQLDNAVTISAQQAYVNFITPNPQTKFAYITNSPNVTEFKNLNLKGFSLVHDAGIALTGDRSRILLDGVLQKELCGYRDATITTRSIAANSSYTSPSFTLSGARLGDIVQVSAAADLLGCLVSAYVSANNSIKVMITNPTTAAITIPDIALKLRLIVLPS